MTAQPFLIGLLIMLVFFAIGIGAIRLKNPKLLALIAGLMVGGLVGFFLALFWGLFTGNLIDNGENERVKAALGSELLIIGCTAVFGAFMGFIQTLPLYFHKRIERHQRKNAEIK